MSRNIEFVNFYRSNQKYIPINGDILELQLKEMPYQFHCKVICNKIESGVEFINHCALVYIFAPQKDGLFLIHNQSSLISVVIFPFDDSLPKEFRLIGNEPVKEWETSLDVGIEGSLFGEFITDDQIDYYKNSHRVVKLQDKKNCNIAVPFYDCDFNKLDHIPNIQLQSGYTTKRGIFQIIALWLDKQ